MARQALLNELRALTYNDLKKNFRIDSEGEDGAWILGENGRSEFHIGRTNFSDEDLRVYGIKEVECADVRREYKLGRQDAVMEFPGGTGIDGYIVGVKVIDHWKDGTNGSWQLPNYNFLGGKHVAFRVESAWTRGMHWGLRVLYIPRSDLEESK